MSAHIDGGTSTLCTPVHKQGAPTTCLICKREEGQECLYATLRNPKR